MMFCKRLVSGLLSLFFLCTSATAATSVWEADISLSTLQNLHIAPPATLVPKQSIQMTSTVWMPEKVNWFPQFPDWDMPGATIVPLFMLSPSIERQQSRFIQRGATQNYLLTPLREGVLKLNTTTIIAYPDQKNSPVMSLPSVSVDVKMPPGAGDIAQFLPATQVRLMQTFYLMKADKQEQEIGISELKKLTLKSGQLIERRILMEASGLQGNLIPALQPDPNVIQHDAETTDVANYDEFIGGTRTEHWYYAAETIGTLQLPDISVRWFDTQRQHFRTTILQGLSLNSKANGINLERTVITLKLSEWLSLVPPKTWWEVLAFITFLSWVVMSRGWLFKRANLMVRDFTRKVKKHPRIRLTLLCLLLAMTGPENKKNQLCYQRWLSGQNSDFVLKNAALKQWSEAVYRSTSSSYPSRFTILHALFFLPKTGEVERIRSYFSPVSLPELRSSCGDSVTASSIR